MHHYSGCLPRKWRVCLQGGLAIQEYEFNIQYKRGKDNGNADALSRKAYPDTQIVATTSQTPVLNEILCQQQATDPVIQQLYTALSHSNNKPVAPKGSKWRQPPLSRYRQLWPQLLLSNGIVCR